MSRVVVLRPEPGASETAKRARMLGLEPVRIPLFDVGPLAWEAPDPARFDAVLLTSANAIRCGGGQLMGLRMLPVHAVGDATAQAAREAGFAVASAGDAGVDALLSALDPSLKLLHLCGEDRREPQASRQAITSLAVYRSTERANPDLHPGEGAIVLIHSPRAALRFAELSGERGSTAIVAISAVAAEAAGTGWRRIEIADQPNDQALLALAARLCNIPAPQ
ncbi:uroporphyrinogen-III synthase [Sphingomonas sp. URHD0057]|uniref:uroporphyrinogen-III synthase n=1 Tax=Sphingomonas sp. URHD0057 TaxID=1380389 RepID=UPI00048CDC84|nr:uroporphyrinogen-III synthase [Sphingomonas sp. URHD0057]